MSVGSMLPTLSTSRITVSPRSSSSMRPSLSSAESSSGEVQGETVNIEFSLTSTSSSPTPQWTSLSEESGFLRIHFVLLGDYQLSLLPDNMTPHHRRAALSNPESQLYRVPSAKVTLSEILDVKGFTSTEDPSSPDHYIHQLHHEIQIPVESRRKLTGLHSVCFVQMDIEGYMQHRGSGTPHSRRNAAGFGGPLVYDKLLEASADGRPKPPSTRKVLLVSDPSFPDLDGQPFTGPAHYHDTPSPNGHIGWMAGTPSDMGPRLRVANAPNRKVTVNSSIHLNESVDISFASKTGRPISNSGHGLKNFVGSVIDGKMLLSQARDIRSRARLRLAENLSDNIGVMSYGSQETCSTYVDQSNMEKSYHSTIFGINFLNLLVKNSIFGDILSFHATLGNSEFVNRALLYSEIASLEVNRTRLTTDPVAFNRAGTPSYGRFEFGEVEKFLVYGSDTQSPRDRSVTANSENIKNRLIKAETSMACIEEVEIFKMSALGTPEPQGNNYRQFMIKDYDLFHNVEYGKYTYGITVSIQDGVRWAIEDVLQNLKTSIENYRKYSSQAEIPAIESATTLEITGNHNYETGYFTREFSIREDFTEHITQAIAAYSEIVMLISGTKVEKDVMASIENSISPMSGKLTAINEFLNTLVSLYGIVESTLGLGAAPSRGDNIYHGKALSVESGGPGFNNILEESFGTNIIVEAFNKARLMANYSFPPIMPTPLLVETLRQRAASSEGLTVPTINSLGQYMPQSFVAVTPSTFAPDSVDVAESRNIMASKTQNSRTKGGIMEVSNYSEFIKSSPSTRQMTANKVGLLRKEGSDDEGLINKGEVHTLQSLPKLDGSITLGISAYGANFSAPKDLFELEEFSTDEAEGLPSEVKSAISSAIYRGDDRDLILNSIKDNYRDLSQTKDQLGSVFDKMYGIFAMAKQLKLTNNLNSDYRNNVLGKKANQNETTENLSDPYKLASASPKIVGPDQNKVDLKLEKLLKLPKQSTRTAKKFVVVSIDKNEKDKVMAINNTFLLEI